MLEENKKNLKCVADKERKMSQRGKRQNRYDNDEPPPKKRKGRPPANKSNSSLGNGNSIHSNAAEGKTQIFK